MKLVSVTGGNQNVHLKMQALYSLGILAHLLRMVSWNLNTLHFGGDYTPQSSSDKVIGSLEILHWVCY